MIGKLQRSALFITLFSFFFTHTFGQITVTGFPTEVCVPSSNTGIYTASETAFWEINPVWAGVILGSPLDSVVEVWWDVKGFAQICATSLDTTNATACLDIQIGEETYTQETGEMCIGANCFECGGTVYCLPTDPPVVIELESEFGCDSFIYCILDLIPAVPPTVLGEISLCEDECFEAGDSLFCDPGTYFLFLESWRGCDSVVHFELYGSGLELNLEKPLPLNCNADCPILTVADFCAPENSVFEWSGPNVNVLNDFSAEACEVGEYCLSVTDPDGNQISDCVEVVEVPGGYPEIHFPKPIQTICPGETAQLWVVAEGEETLFQWSPLTGLSNGFVSNPLASPPNNMIYTVTVIDTNDCVNSAQTKVFVNCPILIDTISEGEIGLYSLNFPPYLVTLPPLDLCDDSDDGHVQFQIGNTLIYYGISEGTDTLCLKLQHSNNPNLTQTFEAYITVEKDSPFGFQNEEPKGRTDLTNFQNLSNLITVFPNPATDFLNIISEKEPVQKAEIFDISGKLIKTFSLDNFETKIDITDLESGSYFLKTKTKNNDFFEKIVVIK